MVKASLVVDDGLWARFNLKTIEKTGKSQRKNAVLVLLITGYVEGRIHV